MAAGMEQKQNQQQSEVKFTKSSLRKYSFKLLFKLSHFKVLGALNYYSEIILGARVADKTTIPIHDHFLFIIIVCPELREQKNAISQAK